MPAGAAPSFAGSSMAISFGFDRLQLRQDELEPVELAADLRLQMRRQRAAIAGCELLQPLAPVTAQRLIVANPLGE